MKLTRTITRNFDNAEFIISNGMLKAQVILLEVHVLGVFVFGGGATSKFNVINFIERVGRAFGWRHRVEALVNHGKNKLIIKRFKIFDAIVISEANLFASQRAGIVVGRKVMQR